MNHSIPRILFIIIFEFKKIYNVTHLANIELILSSTVFEKIIIGRIEIMVILNITKIPFWLKAYTKFNRSRLGEIKIKN